MKALTLRYPSLTKEILLRKADETPEAWIGIRIAGLLLILSGWKSTQVVDLFGLTRWSVAKWIRKANSDGVVRWPGFFGQETGIYKWESSPGL